MIASDPVFGRVSLLFATCLLLAGMAPASAQPVVINEIFYHPASANVLEEWIELRNNSGAPVNVGGWSLASGAQLQLPPNTWIDAGSFLVLAADEPTFRAAHPGVAGVVGGWQGALGDNGERVELRDGLGNSVDEVSYASEGDWAARRLGAEDRYRKRSWEWFAEHDGGGRSLELINPLMPNEFGLNWGSSAAAGGTPGRENSIGSANISPMITAAGHFPIAPRSTEAVTVSARLIDEGTGGLGATLHWRVDGEAQFVAEPMFDDGAHGDGLPGDGLFAARLAAHPDKTVVEYFLSARDAGGNERVYPAVVASGGARTANLLLQFDNERPEAGDTLCRLVISKAEYDYIQEIWAGVPNSDGAVSGTLVVEEGVTRVFQSVSLRNRGHGTRPHSPHNIHVTIPNDRLWEGRPGINLNTVETAAQVMGSEMMRRAGLPMGESRAAKVRLNGVDRASSLSPQYRAYAANDQMGSAFLRRQIPGDSGGNLYRGSRQDPPETGKADLAWQGPEAGSYTNVYFKETNRSLNDYSDLIQLMDVLNNTPDAEYAARARQVANVGQWMRYFAINTLMANQETSLATGIGDDYALYRGEVDTRFIIVPYDMDSMLGRGSRTTTYGDSLFRMTVIPALDRMMKHPAFAPLYYAQLLDLVETMFTPAKLDPALDTLPSKFPAGLAIVGAVENMKAFNRSNLTNVLRQISLGLSVTNGPAALQGYPHTTAATLDLKGRAHAARTRRVLVNGREAAWVAWRAEWSATVAPVPGLNTIVIESVDEGGMIFDRLDYAVWRDDGGVAAEGGSLAANATWTAAGGPYRVTSTLTVPNGVTLAIEAGTTVYFASGAGLTVASGGQLLAEGRPEAQIQFTREPGSAARWAGIVVFGGVGTPETRVTHARIEFNDSVAVHSRGGTLLLDHVSFATADRQYVSLDDSSFIVRNCHMPSGTVGFELAHGTGGIKAGGHGIFARNFVGSTIGYNDAFDFTGGQRGGPILHVVNNVFLGSSDDVLDLDGADAWIGGNIFLRTHKNGSPDSASAVSGGSDSGQTSEITVVGNLFYDCDQAVTAKQGNFYTLLRNTIVRQTVRGGLDTEGGVVNLNDETAGEGRGIYLEGNILHDIEALTRNLNGAQVTFTNNLMPLAWTGPGGGNRPGDPLFVKIPVLAETQFTNWASAQVLRDWLALLPGSPAAGAGPNGTDVGGAIPMGVSIGGAPAGRTARDFATLTVGILRSGNGIPTAGFPLGSGHTHYKWRLDSGPWSAETPVANPIELAGLSAGAHTVQAVGKLDTGLWQDDPVFGPDAAVSERSWVVDPAFIPPPEKGLVLSEMLAKNIATFTSGETTPDLIEIHNAGRVALDLGGIGLSDDPAAAHKFAFPAGATLEAGGYLVLIADSDYASPGVHLGFALSQDGEGVFLTESVARGGARLDGVVFGPQVADYSVGRRGDGSWGLCKPTFGGPNWPVSTGPVRALRINEWLANARFLAADDFVELYNPDPLPVSLGGLWLSDAPGTPRRSQIAPLSFVAGGGVVAFRADGNAGAGPDHLDFKLAAEAGTIHLLGPDLAAIDVVGYGPQTADVSLGRSPNGADAFMPFPFPTRGLLNPASSGASTNVVHETHPLFGFSTVWKYHADGVDLGDAWRAPDFDDSAWNSGMAPLGLEPSTPYPYPLPIATPLSLTSGGTRVKTYYFRAWFDAPADVAGLSLTATNFLDDGAVFHLNGERVQSVRVSDNPARYSSDASNQSDEGNAEFLSVPEGKLLPGRNLMAVEVHQSGGSSSDVMFAMALAAERVSTNLVLLDHSPVRLGEFMARSGMAPGPGGGATPWVEFYNPSTNEVDLHDLSLSDDLASPRRWVFPAGASLPPKSWWTATFDPASPPSSTNAPFAVSWRGGSLYLFDTPARGGVLLDGVAYGLQTPGYTIARMPDGAGAWALGLPTPGRANLAAGLGSPEALRVNEWMADPVAGGDWFELFNGGGLPVAIGGLAFTDDLSNRGKSPLRPLSFIGSGRDGYAQFFADKNLAQGADHVDFRLSKAGSPIGLHAPSGLQIDAVSFGAQAPGVSEGRLPDGVGPVSRFPGSATPSQPNSVVGTPDDTDGDGMPDEWELAHGLDKFTNDSGFDADLDGMSNWAEYVAGTDPRSAESALRLWAESGADGGLRLWFQAAAGRGYRIECRERADSGEWLEFARIVPSAAVGAREVVEPEPSARAKFYRVIALP